MKRAKERKGRRSVVAVRARQMTGAGPHKDKRRKLAEKAIQSDEERCDEQFHHHCEHDEGVQEAMRQGVNALLKESGICGRCANACAVDDIAGRGGCGAHGCDHQGIVLCWKCLEDHDCNGAA